MRGPLSTGRTTRSLLRATGATALLAALIGATTGSAQHAGGHPAAHSFPKPTVSADISYILGIPSGIDVSGQGFTPGDPLHLQLIASDGPSAGSVLTEGDTTASPQTLLELGNGQSVDVGGQFTTSLTASSASPLLCQPMTRAAVTVVDTATGESASSTSVDISGWWLAVGCASAILTVTALEINHSPFSVDALGSGFTPVGLVHIYLEIATWYLPDMILQPVQIVASVETTATAGGSFDVTLGLNCHALDFSYVLIATDEATGTTTSTPLIPSYCI